MVLASSGELWRVLAPFMLFPQAPLVVTGLSAAREGTSLVSVSVLPKGHHNLPFTSVVGEGCAEAGETSQAFIPFTGW